MDFAIIGGTGFGQPTEAGMASQQVITPYGEVQLFLLEREGLRVAFLPRHGPDQALPPHRINYRANIAALRELGVKNILASASVGSLNDYMRPGQLAILTQFLDFTHSRPSTFYEGDGEVVHVDMSVPYCPKLQLQLTEAGTRADADFHPSAVYVCTQGPRFETPAEIRMFRQLGADLVGMTGLPEAVLAREAGLCYASLAVICNWAAGVVAAPVSHQEVTEFMTKHIHLVEELFWSVIHSHQEADCPCRHAAEEGRMV